jgi:hypothetical protein
VTPMAWPWCRGGVAGARLRAGTGATPASRRPLSSAEIHLPPPQKGKGGGQAGLGGAEDCGLSPAGDLERPSSPQLGTATVIQVPGVDSAPRIQQLSLKTGSWGRRRLPSRSVCEASAPFRSVGCSPASPLREHVPTEFGVTPFQLALASISLRIMLAQDPKEGWAL